MNDAGRPPFRIVLLEPEIPPNTGNIARLCAGTGAELHLIEPLGFEINDRQLKRAGMDYWKQVTWRLWPDWPTFRVGVGYRPGDYLVFGRETAGLPVPLLQQHPEGWVDIPMPNAAARSLNLSNCVAIVLFEALRQTGF